MSVGSVSESLYSSSWTTQYIQFGRSNLGKITKGDMQQYGYTAKDAEPLTAKEAGLEVVKASTPNYNSHNASSSELLTKDEVGLEIVNSAPTINITTYSSPLRAHQGFGSSYFKEL